ncbi:MAG TPA: hypothetical protein VKD26_05480 [Streptosporangiaceae bacterium]|nr:hypothetical protein [Streptosporangiaceae bacterium]
MPWKPDEQTAASYAAILRAALPGWGVWWDPFALMWVAVRGRSGTPVIASTPAGLLHRVTGTRGEDVMSEATALAEALIERQLMAVSSARSVTVWRPGGEDSAVLVLPARSPRDDPLWSWQQGQRSGHHDRSDVEGTADAVGEFLAGAPRDEGGQA